MVSEVTEVTREAIGKRRARLRRFLGSHPNVVAWFLPIAAFLFGITLSAAAFVGVWRHTASEADRAHADVKASAQYLARTRGQVRTLRREVTAAQSRLVLARSAVVRSQGKQRALAAKLAAAEGANSRLAARLPDLLTAVESTSVSLARQSASLASALSGLESYVAHGSVDPAFLKVQVQYVISASARVQAGTAELERQIGAAAKTASSLTKTG